ncbi:putative bifunctional amine oxidase [Colletotrichum sp. SAR 10_99]|nr:putative bifunctional amine oxidase [Colletotrichum sp. SAR 10_96]KAJ5018318.1 putative bifunctional amine oxidase [Colletotrichum sp. SAR 10_99]
MSPEETHAQASHVTAKLQKHDAFKYQWSRHVARGRLDKDLRRALDKMPKVNPKESAPVDVKLGAALKKVKRSQQVGLLPEEQRRFKVGIVGAGVAGLFTALALDWINETIEKHKGSGNLKVEYEILEAAHEERLGGRLYTHQFTEEGLHDYYDVGAMRFPRNEVMSRTFRLFDYLGIREGKLGDRKHVKDKPVLIPYYLRDDNNVCPSYFNNFRIVGNAWDDKRHDPFALNEGIEEAKRIPCDGTGWYDQSLTEAALEILDFEVPAAKPEETNKYWWCVDGGAQSIAKAMRDKMKNSDVIQYDTQVVGMKANIKLPVEKFKKRMELQLQDTVQRNPLKSKEYFVVFNSTTLGAANRMDLSQAGLLWDTKQAIRCLNYGASCKVGIKFKSAWWRKEPFNITKGGLARTDLPLQVCVYPSYNIDNTVDHEDDPAVLLVSYTWGQTAQRLATLIASKSPQKAKEAREDPAVKEEMLREEAELKEILLRDLAYLHADWKKNSDKNEERFKETLKRIELEYLEHHAYDWYHDPQTAGAFAYFGPCQFSELPYKWAMELLERGYFEDQEGRFHPSKNPSPSPFFPLPVEMPIRTDREIRERNARDEHGELLHDRIGLGPLMFGAAFVGIALLEYALENWLDATDDDDDQDENGED